MAARKKRDQETDSELEEWFAWQLRKRRITGWVTQYMPVRGRKFRADFAFPKLKLAVEIDGGLHCERRYKGRVVIGGGHNSPAGYAKDRIRDRKFLLAGWKTMRLTKDDLKSGEGIDDVEAMVELMVEELTLLNEDDFYITRCNRCNSKNMTDCDNVPFPAESFVQACAACKHKYSVKIRIVETLVVACEKHQIITHAGGKLCRACGMSHEEIVNLGVGIS